MTFLDALTEHLESIKERDIDRFAATLAAEEVTFVGLDGNALEGRENVVSAHRDWFMMDDWTFDAQIVHTREEAGAGFALTRVQYTDASGEKAFWLSFLFVPQDGNWRCVFDQSTEIAQAPAVALSEEAAT